MIFKKHCIFQEDFIREIQILMNY